MSARVDVHQHVWTEPLVAALARRRRPPRVRARAGAWWLELPGEPEWRLPGDAQDATAVAADGLDRALVCLSSPLGIEALPADEAWPLLDAYHAGAFGLGEPFGVWGALVLDDPDPAQVDAVLARGAAGASIPAGALATPDGVERVAPLLERLEHHDAPLLVHPGPAPWAPRAEGAELPPWWPAMTTYVAEQSAAWHAFAARGRDNHPRLRVVFAMLAGGAPLHAERLAARGGPVEALHDPLCFYDTSSYGPAAVEAVSAVVGRGQLVYGSDRPVVEPAPGLLADDLLTGNAARLLGRAAVTA